MKETLPSLSAKDLSIGFRGAARGALASHLNLTLHPGELVFLLGPNGVGKTTLLKTLSGLHAPLAGGVYFAGRPLRDLSRAELARQRSVVLSGLSGTGPLTSREIVSLGRIPYARWDGSLSRDDERTVDQSLQQAGAAHLAMRVFAQLSDGERQRILIARALAQDTAVILLDEPTAFIDLPGRFELVDLLVKLARTMGKGIILSAHDFHLALSTADRIWLMKPGGTISTGPPEELVLRDEFQSVFQSPTLRFDPETGHFEREPGTGPVVTLLGSGSTAWWTTHALSRLGYRVTSEETDGRVVIEIAPPHSWLLKRGRERITCHSLEELLTNLREADSSAQKSRP